MTLARGSGTADNGGRCGTSGSGGSSRRGGCFSHFQAKRQAAVRANR
ncbi:hypothetical protein [Cohnella thailandensis]|nr:hypothetical protein [Cohnella thailandensis]MBP1972019.1 hypothetical protein [Cohnella thailandensis]